MLNLLIIISGRGVCDVPLLTSLVHHVLEECIGRGSGCEFVGGEGGRENER